HTRWPRDWSSDVCSSDLAAQPVQDVQDVVGAGPVGHDHLMLHPDLGVIGLKALKAIPQIYFLALGRVGQETAALRYHGRGVGDRSEERRVGKEWSGRGGG